jgi:limonene-1,2-epoxide hydrolase
LENADSIAFIRRFLDACVRADPEEFASYFNEDATWWNSPWQPIKGRDAIRDALRRGAERMAALPWEIRHIVADGDVVLTERVDHFLAGNNRISVPCMGAFELRDGKISAWRDYWDARQFEAQMPSSGRTGKP